MTLAELLATIPVLDRASVEYSLAPFNLDPATSTELVLGGSVSRFNTDTLVKIMSWLEETGKAPHIKKIMIKETAIDALPDSIFNGFDSLEELRVWVAPNLASISKSSFEGLGPKLKVLKLEATGIESLESGVFSDLGELERLYVTGVNVPDDFYTYKLKFLEVGVFDGLNSLKKLNLFSNDIESLPGGLFEPVKTTLKFLELQLSSLSNSIPVDYFDNLTVLDPGGLSIDSGAYISSGAHVFGTDLGPEPEILPFGASIS